MIPIPKKQTQADYDLGNHEKYFFENSQIQFHMHKIMNFERTKPYIDSYIMMLDLCRLKLILKYSISNKMYDSQTWQWFLIPKASEKKIDVLVSTLCKLKLLYFTQHEQKSGQSTELREMFASFVCVCVYNTYISFKGLLLKFYKGLSNKKITKLKT